MNPINKFRELAANASEQGRHQYEAAIAGMESGAEMGAEAAMKNQEAMADEQQHRKAVVNAMRHQLNLAAALRALGRR